MRLVSACLGQGEGPVSQESGEMVAGIPASSAGQTRCPGLCIRVQPWRRHSGGGYLGFPGSPLTSCPSAPPPGELLSEHRLHHPLCCLWNSDLCFCSRWRNLLSGSGKQSIPDDLEDVLLEGSTGWGRSCLVLCALPGGRPRSCM